MLENAAHRERTYSSAYSVRAYMSIVMVFVAVCCGVLQCVAVCCGVLQCVAVCCGVLQCVAE